MIKVYNDSAKLLVGSTVNTFPLIVAVNDMALPLLFLSSTQKLLPFLIASLKVTLMVLLAATVVAPFTGSVLDILGATESTLKLVL